MEILLYSFYVSLEKLSILYRVIVFKMIVVLKWDDIVTMIRTLWFGVHTILALPF